MSEINLTRKTFLEKEELRRNQEFLQNNATKAVTLSNTIRWGIIRDNFSTEDLNFKIEAGTNIGSIKCTKTESKAIDSDGNLILQEAFDNLPVTDDSNYYWVRISHKFRRNEQGYVNVDSVGNISGSGTLFSEVLRGQATDVPTKIKFIKDDGATPINSGTYEVVTVGSNISAILTSVVGFTAENDLRMVVIGATPISEAITTEQLEGIYKYDACNIELVPEVIVDTAPESGYVTDKTFYVARVINDAGVISIQDKRTDSIYWASNVPGVSDRLSKFENLNDLSNKATARANLDVYNKQEVQDLVDGVTITGVLLSENNLSDLTDNTAARSNLGVYGTAQTYTQTQVNFVVSDRALKSNVIEKDSTVAYTPTLSTHPANKEYVDLWRTMETGYTGTIMSSKIESASFQCTIVKRGGIAMMTGEIKATSALANDERLFTIPAAVAPTSLFPRFIAGDAGNDTIMEMYFFGNSVYNGSGSSSGTVHYFTVTYFV
jgi:hypothetical protein